ncbi:MAG: MarC family protein [Candidatus Kariarchaeaceae archaeon]
MSVHHFQILEIFITLLIIVDPPGVIAPYLSLTQSLKMEQKKQILRQAIAFSTSVLVVSAFIGRLILEILGLSTFALQIAGGMLFFKFGYDVMNGKMEEKAENESPGLVPLGFPIIAGPGSITSVILISTTISWRNGIDPILVILILCIIIVLAVTYMVLHYAEPISIKLGPNATNAIVKIFGLLIITIGIQLILSGLQEWILTFGSQL